MNSTSLFLEEENTGNLCTIDLAITDKVNKTPLSSWQFFSTLGRKVGNQPRSNNSEYVLLAKVTANIRRESVFLWKVIKGREPIAYMKEFELFKIDTIRKRIQTVYQGKTAVFKWNYLYSLQNFSAFGQVIILYCSNISR